MSIKTKAGLRKVYKKVSPKDRDCDKSNMGKGNADAREEIARRENLEIHANFCNSQIIMNIIGFGYMCGFATGFSQVASPSGQRPPGTERYLCWSNSRAPLLIVDHQYQFRTA